MEKQNIRSKLLTKKNILIVVMIGLLIGAGGGIFMVTAGDNPAFCTTCHIMEPYYDSWNEGDLLANKHANEGIDCKSCHESSVVSQVEEGIKFVTGNYQVPLEKREYPNSFCLDCHQDFEAIKLATDFGHTNPHDSHRDADCSACHSMHQPSTVMCSDCHVFNWYFDLGPNWELGY